MTGLGHVGVITDTGRRRRRNEDAYVCEPPLFAIADGMGGAQAGEVASRLAAAALKESRADAGGEHRIYDLIQEANRRVYARSSTDPKTSGMAPRSRSRSWRTATSLSDTWATRAPT